MDENRNKALAQALGQIEKQFGKGSVMRMGDGQSARDIEAVSTGSIGLDVDGPTRWGGKPTSRQPGIFAIKKNHVDACRSRMLVKNVGHF